MFVPDAAVESGVTTVSATIGGKKYTAGMEFDEAYKQGYIYTYTLTLNNSGFAITKVAVNPWEQGNDDSATLVPEKDNTYVIKIVASYNEVEAGNYIENDEVAYNDTRQSVQSRSGETFEFEHNVVEFVVTIDWGDGTTDTYTEPQNYPTHLYPNNGTEYIITAKGQMTRMYTGRLHSFQQCLKEIIHIGDCGITSMKGAFGGCAQLTSIPEGLFDKCTEVADFGDTFVQCTSLTTIPEGLFDKCTKVNTFNSVFWFCCSLQAIPAGLFDKCTLVTDFEGAFFGCSELQAIPVGLFDHCTKVINFTQTFSGCSLSGESPYTMINDVKVHLYERANYPEYFTAPTIYADCFYYCTGLSDYSSIPTDWK